jgi:uncharacterized protein
MKLGHIASGNDFFGRTRECEDLWRYLSADHVVASGPRRLGKSSIVNRLREQASDQGVLAEHVDVQGLESVQAFIDLVARHFPDDTVGGYVRSLGKTARSWMPTIRKIELNGVGGIGGAIELQAASSQPWSKSANALQARLQNVPALILIDEFSVFLQKLLERNRDEAAALLAWLRAWRVSPGVACRFLFTGSIGLNSLLEKYGLTAQFNDCFEYPIQEFREKEARDMLVTFGAAEGWEVSEEIATELCRKVGWLSPYYLCLLLDQSIQAARERVEEGPQTPGVASKLDIQSDDIDCAYERMISARSRFGHWEQRLKRDLSPGDLSCANAVLTALSKKPEGLTTSQLSAHITKLQTDPDARDQQLRRLLLKLEEDGYVSGPDNSGRVRYLSFLLRDYWARNHD